MATINPVSSLTPHFLSKPAHMSDGCATRCPQPQTDIHKRKRIRICCTFVAIIGGVILQVTSPPAATTTTTAGGGGGDEGGMKKDRTEETLG